MTELWYHMECLRKQSKDIRSISKSDQTDSKVETCIREVEFFGESYGWSDEDKWHIVTRKLEGIRERVLIELDRKDTWSETKRKIRTRLGWTYKKLQNMLKKFNRHPTEPVTEAMSRLFRILGHEELEFQKLPLSWRSSIVYDKLKRMMPRPLFVVFGTFWHKKNNTLNDYEIFNILMEIETVFTPEDFPEMYADNYVELHLNHIKSESKKTKKPITKKVDLEIEKLDTVVKSIESQQKQLAKDAERFEKETNAKITELTTLQDNFVSSFLEKFESTLSLVNEGLNERLNQQDVKLQDINNGKQYEPSKLEKNPKTPYRPCRRCQQTDNDWHWPSECDRELATMNKPSGRLKDNSSLVTSCQQEAPNLIELGGGRDGSSLVY